MNAGSRLWLISLVLWLVSGLFPSSAFAACSSPPGNAGDVNYSSIQNIMVYCNGTSWIAMGQGTTFGTLTTNDFCTATSGTAIACTTAATGSGEVVLWNSPSLTSPTMTSPVVSSGGLTITAGGLTVSAGGASITGTVSGTTFSGSGASLTNIGTSNMTAVTGTPSATTFLAGNGTWATPTFSLPSLTTNDFWVGNGSSVATAVALSGDCTLTYASGIVCTKTNGTAFGTLASLNAAPAGTLTGTTLASNVVSSSLTGVGTITSGVWNGTGIDIAHGGTNATSQTTNGVNYFNGTSITSGTGFVYMGGQVGIGTTNPQYALDVWGTGHFTGGVVGESASYGLLNVGGTASWIKLGTFTAAQDGEHLYIKVVTAQGYNAETGQQAELYIHFETSNGSSTDANGFAGWTSFYQTNTNNGAYNVKVVGNAAGTSATAYAVYYYQPTYNGNGSFHTVQIDGGNSAASWSNSGTTASDPGSASSTVQWGTQSFAMQSTALFNGNVGIGTTSPGFLLDVNGAAAIANNNSIYFRNSSNTADSGIKETSSNILTLTGPNGGAIYLNNHTGTATNLAVLDGGNVGIGTTGPVNTLDVAGTGIHIASGVPSATTYQLYNNGGTLTWNGTALSAGGGSGTVTSSSAGQVAYYQSTGTTVIGTSTMNIVGGQIGIGTATFSQPLSVNGNIDAMGSYNGYITEIPNSSTATGLNQLAKMYGANTVTIGTTGDTDGMIGIVVGNAGTAGKAQIAIAGQTGCIFDSAPSAVGDFVTISSMTAGDCHDTGTKVRGGLTTQIIGQVMNIIPISGSIYPIAVNLNGPNALPNCSVGDTPVSCGSYWVCSSQRPPSCFASITLSPATLTGAPYGASYSQIIAASGGFAPYSYSLTSGALPSGLSLSSPGLISGTPAAVGTVSFTVTATDIYSHTGSQAYSLTITAPTITLSPTTLTGGTYAVSYSQTVTASGGISPYTYNVTSGSLPSGLSLNASTGAITGTPTATGTVSFTITATDAHSYTGSQAYSLTIATATISLLPTSLPSGTYNTAYSQTVSASGGISPYTYTITSGSLPGGLSINSSTGAITGTPTASGGFMFTVTATDAHSQTGSQSYLLTINAPTITLSPTGISPVYGSAFSQTLMASGGVASYTFAVTSGSLPGGLSLNSSTGAITGTPNAPGAYSFTVTATDAHSQTGSQTYSGTVATPTIALSPTSLPSGTQGAAYSQTISALGGISPYTYSITSGSLPTGISLNSSTGVISGTPSVSGTYSFTVTATDAYSYTGSQSYSLTLTACGGVWSAGYCWYLGAQAQSSSSCDTACAAHGGCNAAGTVNYVGSGGTDANCLAIANLLYTPLTPPVNDWTGIASGCDIDVTSPQKPYRATSPTTTCSTLDDGNGLRVCACNN